MTVTATISMHGWYAMNYNFMYIRRVQYSSCYNMCIATLQVGITSFCAPWHIQANPLVSRGWPFFAHSTYPLACTTQRSVCSLCLLMPSLSLVIWGLMLQLGAHWSYANTFWSLWTSQLLFTHKHTPMYLVHTTHTHTPKHSHMHPRTHAHSHTLTAPLTAHILLTTVISWWVSSWLDTTWKPWANASWTM